MIYRETGQYKSSYKSDHAIFPLLQDKIAFSTLMLIAFLIVPFIINSEHHAHQFFGLFSKANAFSRLNAVFNSNGSCQ